MHTPVPADLLSYPPGMDTTFRLFYPFPCYSLTWFLQPLLFSG